LSIASLAKCSGFDGHDNIALYWGQNSFGQGDGPNAQQRLLTYCSKTDVDIIPMAFLVQMVTGQGGQPVLNFANQQDKCPLFAGTQLINCTQIGEDIKTCQQQFNKTILLSIGGATYTEGGFATPDAAIQAANLVWATFGPMTGLPMTNPGVTDPALPPPPAPDPASPPPPLMVTPPTVPPVTPPALTIGVTPDLNLIPTNPSVPSDSNGPATASSASPALNVPAPDSSVTPDHGLLMLDSAADPDLDLSTAASPVSLVVTDSSTTVSEAPCDNSDANSSPAPAPAPPVPAPMDPTAPLVSRDIVTLRPFGDAVVDGFDFDFETNVQNTVPFATQLRKLMAADTSKKYYLTAAPQCPYPDAAVDSMLNGGIMFDAVFVQFYNNYCGVQSFVRGSLIQNNFNFATWDNWAKTGSANPGVKVYLGVPAGRTGAGSGYQDPDMLAAVLQYSRNFTSFGGVMMWDASQAFANHDFVDSVQAAVSAPPMPEGAVEAAGNDPTLPPAGIAVNGPAAMPDGQVQPAMSGTAVTQGQMLAAASDPTAPQEPAPAVAGDPVVPPAAEVPATNGPAVTVEQMLAAPNDPSSPAVQAQPAVNDPSLSPAGVPAAATDPTLPAGQAMRARRWIG
jgi:hypothetical protein